MVITVECQFSPEDLARYRMSYVKRMSSEDAQSIANPMTREEYERAVISHWILVGELAQTYGFDTTREYRVDTTSGKVWYAD